MSGQTRAPTDKLYEAPGAELSFVAQVLRCEVVGQGYRVVLDRTAFFPEGGGQAADIGTLGGVQVSHVSVEGGVIFHQTDGPLPVGVQVEGQVDALHRLDQAQQHSGEHVLSGIVNRRFGYENVGFHIGEDYVTVDFSGTFTPGQLAEVEAAANALIFRNVPVQAWYPLEAALSRIAYRSKRALSGAVRIVEIPNGDVCACCGTHVARTGEIGLIKIVQDMHYKGGTRLYIRCGMRALADYAAKQQSVQAVSRLLSSKPDEIEEAVVRVLAERDALRQRHADCAEKLLALQIAQVTPGVHHCLFAEDISDALMKKGCALLGERVKLAAVFTPHEGGHRFVIGAEAIDVRPLVRELCEAFAGRGGGKPMLAQGFLAAGDQAAIHAYVAAWATSQGV